MNKLYPHNWVKICNVPFAGQLGKIVGDVERNTDYVKIYLPFDRRRYTHPEIKKDILVKLNDSDKQFNEGDYVRAEWSVNEPVVGKVIYIMGQSIGVKPMYTKTNEPIVTIDIEFPKSCLTKLTDEDMMLWKLSN